MFVVIYFFVLFIACDLYKQTVCILYYLGSSIYYLFLLKQY